MTSSRPSLLGRLLSLPIRFYSKVISPITPRTCRFQPTCSAYAIEALETHGALRGLRLTLWRLLRCQPFARAGWDPVPPAHDPTSHETP